MDFLFSENQEVTNLDKVPKDFQGLYEEKDGKFVLSQDDRTRAAVAAITSLSRSLKSSRAEAKEAREGQVDLSALKDFGSTPDEILEGINARLEEVRKTKPGDKEALERALNAQKQELERSHTAQITALNQRNEGLTGQLHGLLVTGKLEKALHEAGAVDPELVMPHLAKYIKVGEEDGKFAVNVVDVTTGEPRFGGTGNPMSISELVTEFKADERHQALFRSESKSGGGKETTRRTGGGGGKSRDDMSPQEKIQAGLAKRGIAG